MADHIRKRKDKSSTPKYLDGWERTFGKPKDKWISISNAELEKRRERLADWRKRNGGKNVNTDDKIEAPQGAKKGG